MGRLGTVGDNVALGSFFALLRKNVLNRQSWFVREQLRSAIVFWNKKEYHRKRRQAALGRSALVEFETVVTAPITVAA